jgi:hypothetical protein
MAMSDDFGLLNLVVSPFLERVGREERLSGDQPRKPKNLKSKSAPKDTDSTSPDTTQKTDDSISSQHIDLRI